MLDAFKFWFIFFIQFNWIHFTYIISFYEILLIKPEQWIIECLWRLLFDINRSQDEVCLSTQQQTPCRRLRRIINHVWIIELVVKFSDASRCLRLFITRVAGIKWKIGETSKNYSEWKSWWKSHIVNSPFDACSKNQGKRDKQLPISLWQQIRYQTYWRSLW